MKPIFEDKMSGVYVNAGKPFAFPEHMHPLAEIAIVFEGRLSMLAGGQRYALGPGDLCAAFSYVPHGYETGEGEKLLLIFPPAVSQEYGRALMNRVPRNPLLRKEQLHPEVAEIARAICREYALGCGDALIKAYIQVLLARVMPLFDCAPAQTPESSDLIHRVMRALSSTYLGDVSLESLASELNVSKYHLSHLFSEKLHVNFREYVNTLRVDRARMLLQSTDAPITRVCYDCGFENQRTFNRAFYRLLGMTPSAFRAQREE